MYFNSLFIEWHNQESDIKAIGHQSVLHIIKNSLHNRNTTLGENVRYFMHKYNIVFTDWFENTNILYNKIDIYVKHNFDAELFYVGNTIRELCEARDNCCSQFFERGELLRMIDVLCTKRFYMILFDCIITLYCNATRV